MISSSEETMYEDAFCFVKSNYAEKENFVNVNLLITNLKIDNTELNDSHWYENKSLGADGAMNATFKIMRLVPGNSAQQTEHTGDSTPSNPRQISTRWIRLRRFACCWRLQNDCYAVESTASPPQYHLIR